MKLKYLPLLTAPLLFDLDFAVCRTFTMRRACDLELVLLAAVGSCVLSLFPEWKLNENIAIFQLINYRAVTAALLHRHFE